MKNLLNKINIDYISALRGGDKLKTNVLRSIKNAISNAQIEKRRELEDIEVIVVLRKEVSKREESYLAFKNNDREALASVEKQEMEILKAYLPAAVSDEVLYQTILETISEINATSKKQMGDVIKAVAKKLGGAADGKQISLKVKELLN